MSTTGGTPPSDGGAPSPVLELVAGAVGGGRGRIDGASTVARFNGPTGVTVAGNSLYVTDTGNYSIRLVNLTTGAVSTQAGTPGVSGSQNGAGGSARFVMPTAVTNVATGVAVIDNQTVRQLSTIGNAVTLMQGTPGTTGATDGASATFNNPSSITASGNSLFVGDTGNNSIRKIDSFSSPYTTETLILAPAATTPAIVTPAALVADASTLYFADSDGTNVYFRSTTIMSPPTVNTAALIATFPLLQGYGLGMAVAASNRLVATTYNFGTTGYVYQLVQVDLTNKTATSLADSTEGWVDGPVASSQFRDPQMVASDGSGNVYIADTGNNAIRKLANGTVSTLAGLPQTLGSADGTATTARFNSPNALAVDPSGAVFVADGGNCTIRKIESGMVSTVVGTARICAFTPSADGSSSYLTTVSGIVAVGSDIYLSDRDVNVIRKISGPSASDFSGSVGYTGGSSDGASHSAGYLHPSGLSTDGTNIFVADTDNNSIRQIVIQTATASTIAGAAGMSGNHDDNGALALLNHPRAVVADASGIVYVADTGNHTIRKLTLATQRLETIAGTGMPGSLDGIGTQASFNQPSGLLLDGKGNLWVSDTFNSTLGKIELSSMKVSTVAGKAGLEGVVLGSSPHLAGPAGLALDSDGNILIADSNENAVLRLRNP